MDKEHFYLLVARKFAGEATAAEIEELNLLLIQQEECNTIYKNLSAYWKQEAKAKEIEAESAFQKTLHKIKKSQQAGSSDINQSDLSVKKVNTISFMPRFIRIAAILILCVCVGYFAITQFSSASAWSSISWVEKNNSKGIKSKISLPDGSTVWLNADSKIKFPEQFSDIREVYLSGEAFFDVAKNSHQPFIIHLKNSKIRVLGTSFNVKAFDEDEVVETSVVTGKVAFIPDHDLFSTPKDTLLLTPNHKVMYFSKTGKVVREETNGDADKAWTEGKLIFKAMRFEEIARILERNYGKEIVFANNALKNCKLTATFQQESLEEIMFILSKTKDYKYTFSEKKLIISGSGCRK